MPGNHLAHPCVKYITPPRIIYALTSHKDLLMFLPGQQGDLPAFFTALANVTRLRIVEHLLGVREETVNELALALRISQPRVSWHLRMLELGGVVRTRREGRLTY